jgi:HEAT repeat protein
MKSLRRTGIFPVYFAIGLGILFTSLAPGCSTTRPDSTQASHTAGISVQELLSRLPARDAVEQRWVSALFLESAPASILKLCAGLDTLSPGGDTQLRYALSGLSAYATLPGHEGDRAMYAGALCSALGTMRAPPARAYVIQQLQLAGGTESIETLSRFLTDERLCEPAAQALLSIHAPEVGSRMFEALHSVDGSRRITLIRALGELHYRDAVPELMKWSKEDDPDLKVSSLAALAAIGDPRSTDLIKESSLQLTYARRLAEDGNKPLSENLLRTLLASKDEPGIRAAALRQLADLKGAGAMDELVASSRDSSAELRAAALDAAIGVRGEGVTERWVSILPQESPTVRAGIIRMLGRRKDSAGLPAVNKALSDPDPVVRIAAVEAAAQLGGVDAIDDILSLLGRTKDPDEIAAVHDVLVSFAPTRAVPAVMQVLNTATPAAQVMLLQYCSGFGTMVPSSDILPLARAESAPVRLAAMKTLESVATPENMKQLVQMQLEALNEAERNAMQRTVAATAARNPVAASRADAILAALDTARGENKISLLRSLGRVGGPKSLSVLSRGVGSKDPAVKDASLRALADLPDVAALDTLLVIARSKQPLNYRVLAIRGCLRILEDAEFSADRNARMLGSVMAVAPRPEEKRLVLASLGNTRSAEAVRIASDYLSDDSVGLDAAVAIRKLTATEQEEHHIPSHSDVIRAFVEKDASPRVRQQLKEYLDAHVELATPPEGFVRLFNGKDLNGWKGLVTDPPTRAKMTADELARAQASADSSMRLHWSVAEGVLVFDGKGANLCTAKDYGDFELLVDWKIEKKGDSGIYLRGSPQVQIWDPAMWPEGSGGLYNNQKGQSKPLRKADKPIGEWNTFRIRMIGDRVTVYLNDVLVVDNVALENYWERQKPIYPMGAIELQSHSSPLYFRNVFIREIPRRKEPRTEFLFNGKDLTGWELVGGSTPWGVKDSVLFTEGGGGGWISTAKEYDNFKLELEFRVPNGGNSGVFLRTPREGDPAYVGMEIQVLDDYAKEYATLHPWQYTGSVYGVQAPSVRASKKAGEWQDYVIVADGPHVTVTLNHQLIIDADLISHLDLEKAHPGLKRRKGYIGLQNHSTKIEYRNIRITEY